LIPWIFSTSANWSCWSCFQFTVLSNTHTSNMQHALLYLPLCGFINLKLGQGLMFNTSNMHKGASLHNLFPLFTRLQNLATEYATCLILTNDKLAILKASHHLNECSIRFKIWDIFFVDMDVSTH
jgi:hypothetical protein